MVHHINHIFIIGQIFNQARGETAKKKMVINTRKY